jgi:hydrogenase maturation protein HypF
MAGSGAAGQHHRGVQLSRVRCRLAVTGLVQGIGFRPYVYALARELGLSGSVGNAADGVIVEIEGAASVVAEFHRRLEPEAPVLAHVETVTAGQLPCRGGTEFVIEPSRHGPGRTLVSPDIATCEACRAELADPADRRYRHPFISCTNCGPRFTVVVDLPYDRPMTTMAELPLCSACAAEYADPANRRFHAQTVACPDCGPVLTLRRPGEPDLRGNAAIALTRRLIDAGAIVGVKGIGGYHLACAASDDTAVTALRKRKDRGDKPFAVMVPDLETARSIAEVGDAESALLQDDRRPVVLLPKRRHPSLRLADAVAPAHPDIGVMIAYTPVHHLLFGLPGDAPGSQVLVMTSGNLAGEPIVTDDDDALHRLGDIADAWLGHDRRIYVPCDDSVVRVAASGQLPVRRSRGFAPMPLALPVEVVPALAVGGDLKNTFCVGSERYAWLSAHVGDMDDLATLKAFDKATSHLQAITSTRPEVIIADRHPAYRSATWARRNPAGLPVRTVQHHHAHVASAMAENRHDGREPVIGVAFDGTGYGDDRAVWGGEILLADYEGYERVAHLRYVSLPGGDAGVRNPCRMALSHLHSAGVAWDPGLPCVAACTPTERGVLARQLSTGLGCTPTSSMGRLFDALSSLAGVCHRVAYEAEAAMRFEGLARDAIQSCAAPYSFGLDGDAAGPAQLDPGPVIAAAAADVQSGVDAAVISARFHIAVARLVINVAMHFRDRTSANTVALSGGVFLNALLSSLTVEGLTEVGFQVLRHRLVPPSDAGLALGQLVVGAHIRRRPEHRGAANSTPTPLEEPCA